VGVVGVAGLESLLGLGGLALEVVDQRHRGEHV
jgi:hypothetical protein